MELCHEKVIFNLPDEFYSRIYCDKKPTVLLYQLRKAMEHFMNTSYPVLCPVSEQMDAFNICRKQRLNALDRITFDIDDHMRCGWMIVLGEDFNITSVFFLEYENRFVLIKSEFDFLNFFKSNIVDLDEMHDSVLLFDSGVVRIKKDEFGMRWLIITEMASWQGVNVHDAAAPSRIVMSEAQFYSLKEILNTKVSKARYEINYLRHTYNVALREFVMFARLSTRANCTGCMRSDAGTQFICGRGDSVCIEALLHSHLQRKIIAGRHKCLKFVYENIAYIFPTVARRLKEEMFNEENLLKYYSGGIPDYVKHCNRPERRAPHENGIMDYDV